MVNLDSVARRNITHCPGGLMLLNGKEVHDVLVRKGVTYLHHANTVRTSCSFLKLKGLASRGCVEMMSLDQTPQLTDQIDKRYGIWNDVFTDGVDVHRRGGRKKGANHYGPVLFKLPLSVLRALPPGSSVMVTRKNPYNWHDGEPDSARYFENIAQLGADPTDGGYRHGDFGHHIVIRVPSGILPFSSAPISIELDEPGRTLNGVDVYTAASKKLSEAAANAGLALSITRHRCQVGCLCREHYAAAQNLEERF